jgi:DNA primase
VSLVRDAAERLWRPEGASALVSLQERGLTDETIRVSRLGFVDSVSIPTREGDHCFRAQGVVIP